MDEIQANDLINLWREEECLMQFRKLFNIYDNMQKNGVVIYGVGKEGKLAIEVLKKENVNI